MNRFLVFLLFCGSLPVIPGPANPPQEATERFSWPSFRGPSVQWNGEECRFLTFARRGEANTGAFWFEVDEITVYGTEAWDRR